MIEKLHFVYNVDATPRALLQDFVHRLRDPDTYPCRLCDITYGRFVKKPRWQMFVRSLPVKSVFHTRDRFVRKFPKLKNRKFPAVFAETDGKFQVFISSEELQDFKSLADLETLLDERLRPHASPERSRRA